MKGFFFFILIFVIEIKGNIWIHDLLFSPRALMFLKDREWFFLLKVTQNFSPEFQILTYVMSGLLKKVLFNYKCKVKWFKLKELELLGWVFINTTFLSHKQHEWEEFSSDMPFSFNMKIHCNFSVREK